MEDENIETYFLIWLDSSVDSSEQKLTIQRKLRSSINYLKSFTNENLCEDYIRSRSINDRIILIISGQLGKDLVHHVHHLRQISSIYVFCFDKRKYQSWANQYIKIKCLLTESAELISQIEYDQSRRNHIRIAEPLSISIFDEKERKLFQDEKSSIDYEFLYSQLLINSLLQMKIFLKDKNALIDYCQNYYRQNDELLLSILEFEKAYSSFKSIWWFTRNCFLTRIIVKALRLKNFHLLFLSRFFLQDIFRELQDKKCLKPIRVYRTQLLSEKEFELLNKSIGKLISINSFFLTNLIRKQSLAFFKESTITDEIYQILFEIDADPKLIGIKAFSNITSSSYFIGEQQILFMPGSIYRINNIRQESQKLFLIHLILSTNFEEEFQLNHDLEEFDLLQFGNLIIELKKYNQAEIYFSHLLNDLPFKHSHIPLCYDALAKILLEKGEFNSSLKWLEKSLQIKKTLLKRNDPNLASIYNNIALVHLKRNDSEQALQAFTMALNIFQSTFDKTNPHIPECFNNMGMVYRNANQYQQALTCYQKAFSIQEESLQNTHPDLAMSHSNLAMVYSHLHQYDLALEHYNQALQIYQQILPLQHSLISMILENIGNIFYDQKQFEQGLLFYQKAEKMYRQLLPSTHPDVLQIAMVIRRIQSKLRYL